MPAVEEGVEYKIEYERRYEQSDEDVKEVIRTIKIVIEEFGVVTAQMYFRGEVEGKNYFARIRSEKVEDFEDSLKKISTKGVKFSRKSQ